MSDAVNNFMTLNPGQMTQLITLCAGQDKPLMIWGPPGCGKTSLVEQAAATAGVPCLTIPLTLYDPVDIRGLPIINEDRTAVKWVPLGELPTEGEGFINLDEINTADPAVMAAAMRLVLARQIGEYKMPDGWRIFATGNRIEDGAAANRMPTALADRFTHATLEVSFDDWETWAMANGQPHELLSFLGFRKDLMYTFDKQATVNTTARGWADVGEVLKTDPAMTSMATLAYVSGRVGQGPAAELRGFLNIWHDLPNIDHILSGKLTDAGSIEKPAVRYAVSMALSYRMAAGNIGHATAFIDQIGAEFTKMALVTAMKRDISISRDPEYLAWATKSMRR